MTFQTTAAYLSGAICGQTWMPQQLCGTPLNIDLRREFARCGERASFRDVLMLILSERGGDFQIAEFSADTRIVIERKRHDGPSAYSGHIRERDVCDIHDCGDLVNVEAYASDFFDDL